MSCSLLPSFDVAGSWWLQGTHKSYGSFQDAIARQPCQELERKIREQQDGGVVALLRDRATGEVFLAASVHLVYHPRWPDLTALQAEALCHQVLASLMPRGLQVLFGG